MATLINATCSECFLPQCIELNPRRAEIACEFCNHSVPMFERSDIDGIRSVLAQERVKAYMALAAFGAAIALFVFHVLMSSNADMVLLALDEGAVEEGYVTKRSDDRISIKDKDTGQEITVVYRTRMKTFVEEKMAQDPLLTEEVAAKLVGEDPARVQVVPQEAGQPYFLILAGIAGLAALVLSAIATQDRLVCEF